METPRGQDSDPHPPQTPPPAVRENRGGDAHPPNATGPMPGEADIGQDSDDDAQWLTGDDFEKASESQTDGLAIRPTEEPAVHPPGPGLPESLVWMGGWLGVQLVGGFIAFALILAWYLAGTGPNGGPASPLTEKALRQLQRDYAGTLFGIIEAVTVIAAIAAVSLRLGRQRGRLLPLAPIPWRHVALILVAMLPLLVLAMELSTGAMWIWDQVTNSLPALKQVDDVSSEKMVQKLAQGTPLFALLFMVAAAPAVGEELVFRGVIGRGLIARWGLPVGVVLTSVLFAAMHAYPPQVAALIPLAVFLHVVYLATRSFWAPVLVHFLNNAFSVVVLKLVAEVPDTAKQSAESPPFSVLLLCSSAFCVVMLVVSLWRSRVEFVDWDGTEWSPGYPAVEWPPAELELHRRCRPTELTDWAPAAIGLGVFVLGMIVAGALAQEGWHV